MIHLPGVKWFPIKDNGVSYKEMLQEIADGVAVLIDYVEPAKTAEQLSRQSRKDAFKSLSDNKAITVGDIKQILEDAGVI